MSRKQRDQINFGVSTFEGVTNEDVEKYMPLVYKIVGEENFGDALTVDEKIAAGAIGVAVGTATFDPSLGITPTYWNAWNVKKAIREETRLYCRQAKYRRKSSQRALRENYKRREEHMEDLDYDLRNLNEEKKNAAVEKAMSVLKDAERRYVEGIVFESKTQRQLALESGVTQSWVSRVWLESIDKMRENVGELDDWR